MKKITFHVASPFSGSEVRELLSFAFQVSLVAFLVLYLIDNLRAGFISNFFNSNIFLWAAIILGILTSVWPTVVPEAKVEKSVGAKEYVWMVVLVLVTIFVVWYKTSSIGWLAWVIAPLSGLIVFGLSLLVYFEKEK